MNTELLTLNCKFEEEDRLMISQHASGLIEFTIFNDFDMNSVVLNDEQLKELIHTLNLKVG